MNAHVNIATPTPASTPSQDFSDPKQFLAQHGVEIDDAVNDAIKSRLNAKREGTEQAIIVHID
jgi:hypothetical protein